MLFWGYLLFQLFSLLFCLLATRATFHYLSKHQIVPQQRYLLFGKIRTRHFAFFYVLSILTLSIGCSLIMIYYHF